MLQTWMEKRRSIMLQRPEQHNAWRPWLRIKPLQILKNEDQTSVHKVAEMEECLEILIKSQAGSDMANGDYFEKSPYPGKDEKSSKNIKRFWDFNEMKWTLYLAE